MYFRFSLEPRISVCVKEVGDMLLGLKGNAQVNMNIPNVKNQITLDADDVLLPLMDLLDGMKSLWSESDIVAIYKLWWSISIGSISQHILLNIMPYSLEEYYA